MYLYVIQINSEYPVSLKASFMGTTSWAPDVLLGVAGAGNRRSLATNKLPHGLGGKTCFWCCMYLGAFGVETAMGLIHALLGKLAK